MALASLRPQEAVQVLAGLMGSHPELVAEMENLAAEAIAPPSRDQVEASVSRRLRGLDIDDLAELAGMHRGRYVQPWTAAGELIDGIVGPYLEDVRRLAGLGRVAEAHQVAVGVLPGCMRAGTLPGMRCSAMWNCRTGLMRYYAVSRAPGHTAAGRSVPRCVPRLAPGPVTCPGTGVMDSRAQPLD